MKIEIVAYDLESAIKAQQGGADRVELCDSPGDGGTTPSFGVIELARQHLSIDLYVMIRPRGGDFLYNANEYFAMRRDIEACKKLSVDGVVFGLLNDDGTIDKKRCQKLVELARPMKVTCHRAFDMTVDPFAALEDCIEVGFDRVLTSGQQDKAVKGVQLISALIKQANGRIAIMPGSGVDENTVSSIVSLTGAEEIHSAAVAYKESAMKYRNPHIDAMGVAPNSAHTIRTVDPERVTLIRRLASEVKTKSL